MEGPFQKGDVAKRMQIASRRRSAFQPAPALGQQDERKIGPLRLPLQVVVLEVVLLPLAARKIRTHFILVLWTMLFTTVMRGDES